MSDTKKYTGSCHCGNVRYEATTSLTQVISCNCSICLKKGYILTFIPEEQFQLLSGEQSLTNYQFHKKRIDHLFCSTCGVSSFGKGAHPNGKMMYAVNVRCLDGVDFDALKVTPFEGKNL